MSRAETGFGDNREKGSYFGFFVGCLWFGCRAFLLFLVSMALYECFVLMISYSGGMSLGSIISNRVFPSSVWSWSWNSRVFPSGI